MKKYKSEMRMVMYQDALSLYRAGAMSAEEMRHFDEVCLVHPQSATRMRRESKVNSEKPRNKHESSIKV